jgi:hypothetical protein
MALTEIPDDMVETVKIVDRSTGHFITAHAHDFNGSIKQLL